MTTEASKIVPIRVWIYVLIIALALNAVISLVQSREILSATYTNGAYNYSESNTPMLSNLDGYRFLREARELTVNSYSNWDPLRHSPRNNVPPLLCYILALGTFLGGQLELIAFWLPPILACLTTLGYVAWGYTLQSPYTALGAVLFSALSPYWIERTCIGRLDTDCLVPLCMLLLSFFMYRFVLEQGLRKLCYGIAIIVTAAIFTWWWAPGLILALLFVALYCGTFSFFGSRTEYYIKIGMMIAFLGGCFLPSAYLPEIIAATRAYAVDHLGMILHGDGISVMNSIEELASITLPEFVSKLSSGTFPTLLALLGTGLLCYRNWLAALFLSPMLCAEIASFYSERLLILGLPLVALGFGYAIQEACNMFSYKGLRAPFSRQNLLPVVAIISLAIMLFNIKEVSVTPRLGASEDALAIHLRQTEPDGIIWSWWDYGYFIQFRGGRTTFIDGGRQSEEATFVSAFPLATDNALLARNWMRFFALKGESQLEYLSGVLHGREKALAFLREVFSLYERDTFPVDSYHIPGWPDIQDRLYPKGHVYVFLPKAFLRLSGYWYAFGQINTQQRVVTNHVDFFSKTGFVYKPADNMVYVPEEILAKGYTDFGAVIDMDANPLTQELINTLADPIVITSNASPHLYIVDKLIVRTVAFRLLVSDKSSPDGFTKIFTSPTLGGLWEVSP